MEALYNHNQPSLQTYCRDPETGEEHPYLWRLGKPYKVTIAQREHIYAARIAHPPACVAQLLRGEKEAAYVHLFERQQIEDWMKRVRLYEVLRVE